MTKKTACFLLFVLSAVFSPFAMPAGMKEVQNIEDSPAIQPMRERVKLMQKWWAWKKRHVLPRVMREQNVDMWIVRNNEADLYYNNEGPVFTLLLPANPEGMTFPSRYAPPGSQRIPGFLMFHDRAGEVEYIEPRDYAHITELVRERDPAVIAVGRHNDGGMIKALGERYAARTVDSWTLGVRWLETMSPEMISVYHHVQRIACEVIAEAYSNRVVIPDVTTTDDLNWWIRHRYLELDLETENHPSIIIQRSDENMAKYKEPPEFFRQGRTRNGVNVVVRRGDIISCDTDLFLLGMVTDSHQHAYVLKRGETDVPEALKQALIKVNRMQDLFRNEFVAGRTGKQIVAAAGKIPLLEGVIESELGFHPPPMFIRRFLQGGYMFDHKTYVAGMTSGPGYYPTSIVTNDHNLHVNTLYAFEPHTRVAVPGWAHGVELGIGQITAFTEDGLQYLYRPQERDWHVIR